MFSPKSIFLLLVAVTPLVWAGEFREAELAFGRAPTPAEVTMWDIDVRPDGAGLPVGNGTVAHGREVYEANCQGCHGQNGQGGIKDRLAGGIGSLASQTPVKTVGSYWPYATTLYDYIRRAMPYQAPSSLSNDDYYALSAYLLYINGIIQADSTLNQDNLPRVAMPNREGFVPEPEFRVISNSRLQKNQAKQ